MGALLDDVTVVEDDDLVGITDGGEAVGDDEGGAPLHDGVHALLHQLLSAGVDRGGRLVKDEDGGIGDSGTGDGKELALSLAEVATIATEHGVVAASETADEVVGTDQSCRLDTLLVGGIEFAIADVVEDSPSEEVGLLQYDAHALAEGVLADRGDGNAVVENLTALYLVETVDEVDDGGLARSRTSDKGNLLSRVGVDIDIEEHLLVVGIAEVDILEVDITFWLRQFCLTVVHLWLSIAEGEDTLGSNGGVEHAVDLLTDLCDGACEVLVELEESDDGT